MSGLLNCHSDISCDPEILSSYSSVPKATLLKRAYHCPTSVYGFKLLMYHMIDVHQMESPVRFLDWLSDQHFKVIYLRRKDRLRHAMSLVVSAKRKILHQRVSDKSIAMEPVQINPADVLETVAKFEANYQLESDLLTHIPHLSLTYEEDLEAAHQHQVTSDRVFDYLELPSQSVKAKLKKIMPVDLSQSILNYEDVMTAIDRSQYSHLLV